MIFCPSMQNFTKSLNYHYFYHIFKVAFQSAVTSKVIRRHCVVVKMLFVYILVNFKAYVRLLDHQGKGFGPDQISQLLCKSVFAFRSSNIISVINSCTHLRPERS